MTANDDDVKFTADQKDRVLAMLKEHERATVVWDFFVWLITMIAKVAAAATPVIAMWKFWLADYFLKKGSIP